MKISFFQVLNHETEERIDCGEAVFVKSTEQTNILFVKESEIKVAHNKLIHVSSTYDSASSSISIFIKENDLHVFTAMFNWNHVTPYFAFRLWDGVFTELYFKK